MSDVYLTIDDSPSPRMDDMVDALEMRGVPALFFCRGDFLTDHPQSVIRAIQKGCVIANHNYSHRPAGALSYEEIIEEIEKTERLIDAAYQQAGKARPGLYFRFPYLDRGCGDRVEQRFDDFIEAVTAGRPVTLKSPDPLLQDKKDRLQSWLAEKGFGQPFPRIDHPLYAVPEIAGARDCFMTYSAFDWMLKINHKGKWPFKTIEDLKQKIDDDPFLLRKNSTNIVLLHDNVEIYDATLALIDHMLAKGIKFLPYPDTKAD